MTNPSDAAQSMRTQAAALAPQAPTTSRLLDNVASAIEASGTLTETSIVAVTVQAVLELENRIAVLEQARR